MLEAVTNNVPVKSNVTNQSDDQVQDSLNKVHWESLAQEEQSISVPTNPFDATDPSINSNNNRCNLKESFTILKFNLTSKVCRRVGQKQNLTMDCSKPTKFDVPRTVGRAKLEWLEKHNLYENAPLVEWLKAMLRTK